MARYSPEHKDATRRRMIETAGRRFKSDGFDGSGIATLVADAGLTNGAFYGHFASKDDLIATVVAEQLADQVAASRPCPSASHRSRPSSASTSPPSTATIPASGCPSAALLDEIGRRTGHPAGLHRRCASDSSTRSRDTSTPAIRRRPRARDRALHAPGLVAAAAPALSPIPSCPTRSSPSAYQNAMTHRRRSTPPSANRTQEIE